MSEEMKQAYSFKEEFGDAFAHQKVLITGATGFIGYSLCSALRELGADIRGIALGGTMAAELEPIPLQYFDLNDSDRLVAYLSQDPPAFVFHLASLVETGRDLALVLPTLKNNLLSTVNLMYESCQRIGNQLWRFGNFLYRYSACFGKVLSTCIFFSRDQPSSCSAL